MQAPDPCIEVHWPRAALELDKAQCKSLERTTARCFPTMSSPPNVYAYRGRHLLSEYHARHKDIPDYKLSDLKRGIHHPAPTANSPVCIIGAGMAGLYTAMILESLKINYQIVDADTPQRVGGRVYTYYFPDSDPTDYFVSRIHPRWHHVLTFAQDVGAMRFPNTPFMKRTYDLAKNRGLQVSLDVPYIMSSPNTIMYFNGNTANEDSSGDPFHVSDYVDQGLTSPSEVQARVAGVIQPFRNLFIQTDIATAMSKLFSETNKYSMRSYMFLGGMNSQDINWCETLDKSTGWYDRALTEST